MFDINQIAEAGSRNLREQDRRDYLGASAIGNPCAKKTWLDFRWASQPEYSGKVLRIFEVGHRLEGLVTDVLEAGGLQINTVDAEGKQYGFVDLFGHFRGSCDGIIELEDGRALLEVKTHNDKSFKDVESKGVQVSKIQHYVQMQTYMHQMELDVGLYAAINKNDCKMYFEWVRRDDNWGAWTQKEAKRIILAQTPPEGISTRKDSYTCKMCNLADVCYGVSPPDKNCRTCKHARPSSKGLGEWGCVMTNELIDEGTMVRGCDGYTACNMAP